MLRELVGEPLESITAARRWASILPSLRQQWVSRVDTHGKHLLIRLSGGTTIHCHAMQYGSWQIGPRDEAMRKVPKYSRLRLDTQTRFAVFYHGPVVEFLSPDELTTHPKLQALGPDVMDRRFDRAAAWLRVRREAAREIGDVVLDQRVIAGIGNIYKSEALFLASIDPRRKAGDLTQREVGRIWSKVAPLMREGAKHYGPTITVPAELSATGARNWTYRRRGHRCFRCGEPIAMVRQGEHQRATYFCGGCQR